MDPSSSTDYESTSRLSSSTLWGYTTPHVSELNVQAILSSESEGHGHAPVRVKLFWSTEIVEGLNLLSRYHSGCIQIKSGKAPPPYDFRITVDNQSVTSEWVAISEKSQIQIGRTSWRLKILQIKEFTITKFLGGGGSAFVYEVQIPDRPSRYAIKIPRYPENDHLIRGEHQMLKDLEADGVPGVVRALGIMRCEGYTGPVLELELGGRSLIDRANDPRRRKPFNVNHIARSLSKTLAEMHIGGVDHGDIKPSNILLSPKGSVTLIDITKVKASTPDFAPPEAPYSEYEMDQIDDFTPETDCYQLSMVLCMLLHVNKDPHIVSKDPKKTGLYGHSEKNGKRRAHFAVLRQTVGELEVDFVKRLHAKDPRQRLTMSKALEHPYLHQNGGRRALRSRVAAY